MKVMLKSAEEPRPATPPAAVPVQFDSVHIEALAQLGMERRYRRGTLIIQEGDQGDTLYIVLGGRLRAFVADIHGKELTLGRYGPGEYVGEMSLDGNPRAASVEAMETTLCAVVKHAQVQAYITEHPDFAMELVLHLIRRVRLVTDQVRSVALNDVYGRLTRLLDQLADPPDEQGRRVLRERLTHQQIASYLACSREMVSRLLKDLDRGGYVEVRERRLALLRPLPVRGCAP